MSGRDLQLDGCLRLDIFTGIVALLQKTMVRVVDILRHLGSESILEMRKRYETYPSLATFC